MSQPLIVTAAIVTQQGRILITQRLPDTRHAGLWEFPGGKLEAHESPSAALQREIREELGVEGEIGDIFDVVHHHYDWGAVLLLAYHCRLDGQPLQHLGVADHRWVAPKDLGSYPMLPADTPLVARLTNTLTK